MEKIFLPGGRIIAGIGTDKPKITLMNCFTLDIEDDLEDILNTLKIAGLISSAGGGIGINFSKLREKGAPAKQKLARSSGVCSFMQLFDSVADVIKVGSRRCALLGILEVDHPDIFEFINFKRVNKNLKWQNFNISVATKKNFWYALENGLEYNLKSRVGSPDREVDPNEILRLIAENAWANGDPGVIFLDRYNENNPLIEVLGEIKSANACSELPMYPYEACCLGSINLANLVEEDGEFNWSKFHEIIYVAVRFLDDVLDISNYIIPEIEDRVKKLRRLGLGVMGFHEMLLKQEIKYSSNEAIVIAEEIAYELSSYSIAASMFLVEGLEREPYYYWKEAKIIPGMFDEGCRKRRNVTTTCIAPTGSLHLIAETSSGIEPFYSKEIVKKTNLGLFEQKISYDNFEGALEISPEQHLKIQAAFQKHIHSSISKTVNLPNSVSVQDVEKIIKLAYMMGCKSVTVYRDGSREEQVFYEGESMKEKEEKREEKKRFVRPTVLIGETHKVPLGCGSNLYVTLNKDEEGKLIEVFLNLGKSGGCVSAFVESLGRLISIALQSGVEVEYIQKQLAGITCSSANLNVKSCPDAVAQILTGKLNPQKEKKLVGRDIILQSSTICPHCKSELIFQEGCFYCPSCGYSKC